MEDCLITDHLVVFWFLELFMQKDKPDSNYLLGAYSAMNRQIGRGKIKMYNRHEMLDVVLVDGKARGIIARNLITWRN